MFALGVVALLATSPTTVASIRNGNALTLPAARHLQRLDPQNGKPATWLLALQQDGAGGRWLGWWRSDDEARTWTWYAPIQNTSVDRDTADTVAVGMDVALVYSFEGPTLSGSTAHGVWFQWWRWNGNTDWVPQAPVNVFTSASSATAYARAEIAVDSQGRIWVWAQRLNADGSFTMVMSVSTDGGATFAAQPVMDSFATRPGGRIMAIGGNRLMLLYSAQGGQPGFMRTRSDADALSAWSSRQLVFSEGIYHGAGMSAVDDGSGGVHLVYKDSAEELRYRHYDGASWSSPQLVESTADWALQPAITRVGTTVVIFWNRMIAANTDYRVYYRTLSNSSLSAPQVLDGTGGFKGYPAAAGTLPSTAPAVVCVYGNTPDASSAGVASLVFAPTPGGIASSPPPPPPPPPLSNGVLFSDDFNRSNSAGLGPNWKVLAGVWFDNGKAAQTDSHPLNRATVANISCADCRIDAQMVNFGGGDSMLELRAGGGDRYALALRTDGVLEIRRYSGGGVTVLGGVASGISDLRSWNSFSFVVQGTAPVSLTGYVNGTPKITAMDASSAALTAPGAAGVAATLAGILFDNFTLSGISSGGGGAPDGGVSDGGITDGGTGDAGTGDAGTGDAGVPDGGTSDGGTPAVGVLFSDDFNRSNSAGLGSNWKVLAGAWFDNGKAAQTDSHPLNRATVANISCADCRIDAQMVNFGGGDSMLELRAGNSDRYALALRIDGVLEIRRYSSGGVIVLGSVASGITDLGSWNSFSFVVQGTAPVSLTGYVNGTPKITAMDASSAALTAPGAAGVAATLAGILFDNFTLSGISSGGGGATDGGVSDGGTGDAGIGDAGVPDGGTSDGGTPTVGVLFSDDFNRSNSADLGPNWKVLAGVWFDNGKAAQTDSHPLNRATVANISCADCRIDAQMVNFGGGESMLELRAGSSDRYALALRTDGILEIRRYSGGGVTVLGSVISGITDLGSWNSFSFVVQGSVSVSLTGYVNGTPKITATDASSAALTAAGAAGVAATLAGILFDNFTLSGISSGGGGAPDGGVSDGGITDGGSPPSGDWPMYRHDLSGTSNGAGSISAGQAASLKVLYKVSIPASVANPVVASGTLYVASGSGKLLALDPRTGATRWSRSTGVSSLGTCATYSQGAVGAAAVVGSTVFAPGGDGRVHSFDTATGNELWATQIANTANDEFLWSSVIPIGGGVYVGVATLEEAACSLVVPGRLVRLDEATGAVTGTWWSDANQGAGGGIWTSAAFDPILGRIFVTTGNVANGVSATSEPWQQAFASIDPSTMHTADSYQPIQTDFSTDWDFGASPTLFDAGGRHLVAAANKNGLVYALERTNLSGGVLWTSTISGTGDSPDLGVGSIVSPTFANGLLFVAGGATTDGFPGAISALDPATGTTVWKMHPDGFVLPAMAAAGGVLAAGVSHSDGTGRIYVLDQTSGAAVFTLATDGKIFAEPTWANGVLYVVDLAGFLYALSP